MKVKSWVTAFRRIGILVIVLIAGSSKLCNAQQADFDLRAAIDSAQHRSLAYKISKNTLRSAYWNFQYYKAGFLPKLSLSGTLPDYYNTINAITLPNGQNTFVNQNVANSSLGLNVQQNVYFTGGSLSASTSLKRIDNFGAFRNVLYTSVPFTLTYYQNNLFYNDFSWQKKIEPIRFREAQKGYMEELEGIAAGTVDKYFTLLLAQVQLRLDQQNYHNMDTLMKITTKRFSIGTVQLNDLLQAKVSLLNSRQSLSGSLLALETAQQSFVKYIGISTGSGPELHVPDSISFFSVDLPIALEKARANRKFVLEFERRKLTAEQDIQKVKSQTGPIFSVNANIGLTQTGNDLSGAYYNPIRNQSLTLSFYFPLVDWGVNKSNRNRAEANLELEKNNISQETLTIEQDITYTVKSWGMQREIMEIAEETSKISQQRYEIAKKKYASGSLTLTDFSNAQIEKDKAVIDYMNKLYNYWKLYFSLRKMTLFDFTKQSDIAFDNNVRTF